MTIVTATNFRANMTKYFDMVDRGERIVVKSRKGSYDLKPAKSEKKAAKPKRDVTAEVCKGLQDFRAYLDGDTSRMLTWEEMMDELHD